MRGSAATSDPARPRRTGDERGFALVVVLWGLVLLALVTSQIAMTGRLEVSVARNLRDAATAEQAADGAVFQAVFHLLATDAQHWTAAGDHQVDVGGTAVAVAIENLAGRVNPNTATLELLAALLVALDVRPGDAAALAAAIVTRRAPPDRPTANAASPPGAPFTDLDELASVPGMPPALLARLRPHLTLWWDNDPEPALADPVVSRAMRALGDTRSRSGVTERPLEVVGITVRATRPGGGRFARHADIALNRAAPRQRWRILTWERSEMAAGE